MVHREVKGGKVLLRARSSDWTAEVPRFATSPTLRSLGGVLRWHVVARSDFGLSKWLPATAELAMARGAFYRGMEQFQEYGYFVKHIVPLIANYHCGLSWRHQENRVLIPK